MEAARRGPAVVLVLALLTVPAAPAVGGDASTPAEPVLEATEPAVLSDPTPRGDVVEAGAAVEESVHAKTVDGSVDDWIGESTGLSGTTVTDHGERIWQGFLFDDFGADDGRDRDRLRALGPAYKAEQRAERLESTGQAAEEQFGAPQVANGTVVTPPNYGDAAYPVGTEGQADLTEVRLAADAENVYVLARFATLTDASTPALFLLADRSQYAFPAGEKVALEAGFDSGLKTDEGLKPVYVDASGVYEGIHGPNPDDWTIEAVDGAQVSVTAEGSTNAIEVRIPRETIADPDDTSRLSLALGAGIASDEPGPGLADVTTGEGQANLIDVASRHEPKVSNWFDRDQALSLHEGTIDPYFETVDLDALAAGTSQPVQPTPGYHQVVFESSANISSESAEQGPKETILQPYGLYLPSEWEPGDERPLTTWLHYRGGTTHQAAAWIPRIVEQLGEDRDPGNIMVFPRGRGTSTWYAGAAHLDVLQVLDHAEDRLEIDEDRRYLAGYSMGGYGSYLFGLLYPDRFAGAYPISGAMTIGLWAGAFEDGRDTTGENGGDGDLENTFRLVENARNLPYVIHHGTNDELVPVTGVQRMATKFAELGYEYRFYRFLGYEHFTQAVIDEWEEGADYLDEQTRPETPARVVYKRVPALENAIETLNSRGADIDLNTDGAYWVSNVDVRETSTTDPSVHGLVDARSQAIPDGHVTTPEAGAASPGHSSPYVMDGLDWTDPPCPADVLCPLVNPVENELDVEVTNVAKADVSAEGAQLDLDEGPITVRLETDGPSILTVHGEVTCEGGSTSFFVSDGRGSLRVTGDGIRVEAFTDGRFIADICA